MANGPMPVGVREFREDLARYLDSPEPIAVTRHGQVIGYYLPVKPRVNQEDLNAFDGAAERLQALLADHGISEDEVVREFRTRRKRG